MIEIIHIETIKSSWCLDNVKGLGVLFQNAEHAVKGNNQRINSLTMVSWHILQPTFFNQFYSQVAELSEPTCSGVQEAMHSVVHGLLATLAPKMHSKAPPPSENATGATLNFGKDDCAELVENTSLHFQPLISVPRDYLARLLFW